MKCPKCNSKTYVVETRKKGNDIIRKRQCPECKYRFITEEKFIRGVWAQKGEL